MANQTQDFVDHRAVHGLEEQPDRQCSAAHQLIKSGDIARFRKDHYASNCLKWSNSDE